MAQSINLSNFENLILRNVKVKKEVFTEFLESNQEIVEEFLNEIKEAVAGHFHTEYPQISWIVLEKVLSKYGKEYFKDAVAVEINTKKRYYDRNLIVKTKLKETEDWLNIEAVRNQRVHDVNRERWAKYRGLIASELILEDLTNIEE